MLQNLESIISSSSIDVHLDCELINQEEANALYNKGTESIMRTLFGAIKVKHIDAIAKLFEIANELVNSDQAELIFYPISSDF